MPIEIGISTTVGGIAGNTPGETPAFSNTKSILLDGFDDFVTMGNVLNTSNTGADELSISVWYKTTTNATQLIVAKWANQSPFNGYALFLVGKELRFFIGSFVGNAYINVKSNSINSLIDGNWHHVVLTYDGSRASSGVKIYVDSTEISLNIIRDVAPDGVSDYSSYQDFMIGVRGNASNIGLPFNGNIDEVSYFNSELSASDVTSIYNGGVPNDISSLSPVSWWRCGDGDTAPTLTDNGSGGNDGTMQSFNTFSTDVPTASSFTNTKSILLDGFDDFVDCGNDSSFNLTTEMTLSAWVKPAVTPSDDFVIAKRQTSDSYQMAFNSVGKASASIWIGSTRYNVFSTTTISANNWFNIVVTFNGSNLKIYVNSVLEGNTSVSGTIKQTTDVVTLASGLNSNAYNFNGNIDEAAIFNLELSASDVTSIYNSGVPNDISSLSPVSWWRCGDGDTSPTLTDNGSASNDGTMTNFSTFSTDVPT